MVGGEAARNAGELLGFQIAEKFAQVARGEDAAELFVALGDALANGEQEFGLGHVHSTANGNGLVRNGEVVAALVVRRAAAAKGGGDLLLVGLFVLAEANVAIDAEDGLAGIGFVFGGEIVEGEVQGVNELAHRLFDFFLEEWLARQEPFAMVVAREAAKELESFGWETR